MPCTGTLSFHFLGIAIRSSTLPIMVITTALTFRSLLLLWLTATITYVLGIGISVITLVLPSSITIAGVLLTLLALLLLL